MEPSGLWRGPWGPQQTPLGELVFVFLPGPSAGAVEGSVTFEGADCLSTHTFEGQVAGLGMEALLLGPDFVVEFEFDLRQAENLDTPLIRGRFRSEGSEGCSALDQPFRLEPEFPPTPAPVPGSAPPAAGGFEPIAAVARTRAAAPEREGASALSSMIARLALASPSTDASGDWSGVCCGARADGLPACAPLALSLVQAADGSVRGLLALEGAQFEFEGLVSGQVIAGVALGGGARLELEAAAAPGSQCIEGRFQFARPGRALPMLATFQLTSVPPAPTPPRPQIWIADQESTRPRSSPPAP